MSNFYRNMYRNVTLDLNGLNNTDCKMLESIDSFLTRTLLFGSTTFDIETNTLLVNTIIDYISYTKRFEEPLF